MRRRSHRPHGPAYLENSLAFEEVAEHRNLACGLYGLCLQVAVRRRWPSFTCGPCSLWRRHPGQDSYALGPATVLPMPMLGR
ncbi:MAG: hypothetical protein V1806_09795 [Pseudomonadota bacterium]